ncbi:low molecular weight phosphatase family protein [Sinomonas sp. JGH33]|uniref:Low molecular weight phosphatase family protein n=1 Tax=Sinomonas terricola TaxID=3110330 RepID=A0ABU5T156_9MICC|nr:low molecular weight phosphatase family protein [Sinomonas sp. JGH33]MEA5453392.1 low molecular weight phosphatase family protein [Sinomonas sp. JGH33]
MTTPPTPTSPFRILVVCTGNICRSVIAEHYLRHRMEALDPGGFEIASAGTGINPFLTPPADIVDLAAAHRLEGIDGRVPRPLEREALRRSDLVLTATHEHIRQVLAEYPAALRRSFTIREFVLGASLADEEEDGAAAQRDPAALVREVGALRSRVRLNQALDIADPFGLGPEAYASMERELVPLLDQIADRLARRR